MNVSYTSRGFELTDQIKRYAEEKLKKIETLDQLIDVNLTLEHARHLFKAELLVHNRNARFSAIEQTPDVFKSINAVIDKMQAQVKRHKGKLIGRKRKVPPKSQTMGEIGAPEPTRTPRIIRSRKQDVKPMSQEEAILQLEKGKESFLVFRDTNSDRVSLLFRRKDGHYGLIEPET
jgi:putative sigma-54 modulation protein